MSYQVDDPSRVAPEIESVVLRFGRWLDRYGETSHDHQSFFASGLGRAPRRSTIAGRCWGRWRSRRWSSRRRSCRRRAASSGRRSDSRSPTPTTRWASPSWPSSSEQEAYYRRAVHFLEVLQDTRCPGYRGLLLGLPVPLGDENGLHPGRHTVDHDFALRLRGVRPGASTRRRRAVAARHALHRRARPDRLSRPGRRPRRRHLRVHALPEDPCGVVNASAYRAFLLTQAAHDLGGRAVSAGRRAKPELRPGRAGADGSWPYATDGQRGFVDHFHTCFVLKALAKIEQLTGASRCAEAIARGVDYYVKQLFDADGLPRPFARAPRLTVYRRELYDYAECLNLAVLLRGRFPSLDASLSSVVADVLQRWVKPDGSFRTRQLLVGWDNVPLHRWAQSQMFRSLCMLPVAVRSRISSEARNRPIGRPRVGDPPMCGICGQYNFRREAPVLRQDVKEMTPAIAHSVDHSSSTVEGAT